jgi:predicted nicotinamide N-methyase
VTDESFEWRMAHIQRQLGSVTLPHGWLGPHRHVHGTRQFEDPGHVQNQYVSYNPRKAIHRPHARSDVSSLAAASPFDSIEDIPSTLLRVPVGPYSGNPEGTMLIPMLSLDCDYVMDEYIKANQYDRDPYWTCIWPSSQAIAACLLHPAPPSLEVAGLRVADFGAGLGLAGVSAAMAGAKEVVFLDRERLSLDCCVKNAELNGCSPSTALPQEFDWNEPITGSNLHGFDMILMCDCLYEKFSVEPIARVLPLLLRETPEARIVLADPPNRAKANRDKFLGLMKVYNFTVEAEHLVDVHEMQEGGMGPKSRRTEIVLMILSRGKSQNAV